MPERASISVGVDGADQAVASLGRIKEGLGALGTASSAVNSVVGGLAQSFGTLGQTVTHVITATGALNVASLVDQVRGFDNAVQRMASAGAGSTTELGHRFKEVAQAIGITDQQAQSLALSLGKATYDMRGAVEAQKGLGEAGILFGRSAQEMQPVGAVLHNVFGVVGDTSDAMGKLIAQAKALGTTGGPAAFVDQITQIGGALQSLGGDKLRQTAALGSITKGVDPNRAGAMQAGIVGALQSNSFDIGFTLGHDILDENGQVKDVAKTLRELDTMAKRRGLSDKQRRLAFRDMFGNEAGSRIYKAIQSGDLDESRIQGVRAARPAHDAEEARLLYLASPEGQAEQNRNDAERAARDAARRAKEGQDWFTGLTKDHPYVAYGLDTAAKGAALLGFGKLAKWGKGLADGAKAARGVATAAQAAEAATVGEGAAAAGGAGLGTLLAYGALPAAAVTFGAGQLLGQDRTVMGREWLASHAGPVEPGDVGRIKAAINRAGGIESDPSAILNAMPPDLRARVEANAGLQEVVQQLLEGIDPEKQGQAQARALATQLQQGNPLPVAIMGYGVVPVEDGPGKQ